MDAAFRASAGVWTLGLFLLLAPSLMGQDANWFPTRIEAPDYPRLGVQACISGTVRLRVTLDDQGVVADAQVVQGHKLLAEAAVTNIRSWSFGGCAHGAGKGSARSLEFEYVFSIQGNATSSPKTHFRYEHPYRALVSSPAQLMNPESGALPNKKTLREPITSLPYQRPVCTGRNGGRRIDWPLELLQMSIPRRMVLKETRDVDYVVYHVGFGPKSRREWLHAMLGLLVGRKEPAEIKDASISWQKRDWTCEGESLPGSDWRGVRSDGRLFRHVSYAFGFGTYEGISAKAAERFDAILDARCCCQQRPK